MGERCVISDCISVKTWVLKSELKLMINQLFLYMCGSVISGIVATGTESHSDNKINLNVKLIEIM